MAILVTATSWAATKTGSWDLTTASDDWEGNGNVTYFTQPYGFKKANCTLTNSEIPDFSTSGITQIKVGFKCLQNGGTTSKITIYLVNSEGTPLGDGVVVTPVNATAATKTEYQHATFTSGLTGATGFMMKVTTFGKNILVNGAEYEVTYSGGQEKTLTSLAVSGTPTKTTYNEGDTFNPAGLTVTGTYSDGNTAPITSGITWTFNPATLSVGQTSVNVTAKVGDVTSPSYTVNGLTVNGMTALTTMDEIFAAATSAGATATDTKVTFNNWVVTGVKNSNAYVTDGTKGFIIYASGIANGAVSADVAEAPEGAEVTLTATPAEGYKFDAWDVKDASSNTIEVANNKFTMPAANVTVSATFVEKPATSTFVLVTNADQLAEGKKIVFVGKKGSDFYSMGTKSDGNNRPGVLIDVENSEAYPSEDVQVFTLEATTTTAGDATWMFNDGNDQYIYAASSGSNHLKTANATTAGDNGKATIDVNPDGAAAVTFQGTNTRNSLKFNNSGSTALFSCYSTGQTPVYIYMSEEAPATKTLDHITLSGSYQTAFNVGDTFNHNGMTVTASYAEEGVEDADVTSQATFSTPDMSQAGTQTVTVSYTEKGVTKTATYDITLTEITKYAVNIAEMANGSVTASPAPAAEGQTVTLTINPNEHYHISALTVTGASGAVTVSNNKFTMPAEDVTVSATFEEDAKYTYTWYVNGVAYGEAQTLYKGEAVTKPADPATPEALAGKVFTGWVTSSTVDAESEPTYVTVDETAKANRSYYAVFATKKQEGGGEAYYEKVPYTNTEWAGGEYLLVYEDPAPATTGKVFNGLPSSNVNYVANVAIADNKISAKPEGAVVISYEKPEGKNFYGLRIQGTNNWLMSKGGDNGLNITTFELTTDMSYASTSISYNATNNRWDIKIYDTYLSFSSDFRAGKTATTFNPIQFYVKKGGTIDVYSEWTTGEVPVLRTLESIALSGEYPTVFEVGDRFSHEGMVVTATYDDATTKVVTSKAKFEVNMAQVGEQTVTVSYTEGEVTKTATYTITIKKKSARAYTLVTSQDDIVDGGEYIILSEDGNYAAAVGTNKRIQTEARGENTYKIVDNTVIVSSYSVTRPYFLVATDGGWYLNDGEYNASLNNKTHVEFVEGTQDVFTVSIAADNTAKITAPAVAEDRQIEYHYWTNNGVVSRAFRYYVSENISKEDYQAIKLYKRVNTVVIEDGYRSKYNESTERNLYKNKLTYDVPQGGDVLKLYRGETLLGTFNVDAANVNYTFTPENAFDADQTNRFDSETVALSGNADDGLTITDYYSEFIEANMPEAVRYSLRDADDVEVGVAVVPLYRSVASARVMMDPDNNVQGYTADDIVNDNAHAANYQNNVRVDVAHADIDGLSGIKVYRDHVVVGEADAAAEYVDVKRKEVRLSNIFESELAVTSAYGENTYGSPKATVHAALVSVVAHEKKMSTYTFTTADGKTGHYFSVLADVKLNQPENGEFELVGVRAWRDCNSSAEPIEQFAGRSNDYNYATILDTDNFTAIEGNEVKNIGSEVISYKDAAGTNFEFGSGVFGSFQEKPTVGLHVRAYYRRAPQSSSAPMQKAPAADGNYYVAETFAEVTFDADVVTGVLDVNGAKEVKSVRYFNIMGVESAEPVDDVNIVVTTYTDGTSSSAKMLR